MKEGKAHSLSIPMDRGIREVRETDGAGRVYELDRWLVKKLLQAIGDPPIGMGLWNGETISTCAGRPSDRVVFNNRAALLSTLANPTLHFGDAYTRGDADIEGDIVRCLVNVYESIRTAAEKGVLWRTTEKLHRGEVRRRKNTSIGSRRNIQHHYDLGNAFYSLWLDAGMVYTCAYFRNPGDTLEEAQRAKMDHVCRKLRLKPGERVVEAGCGWGGLARHMARNYGVTVRAYNISKEQVAHARAVAAREGLSNRVEYVLDDYRNIKGRYDAFVSVGMLEHVGVDHYEDLGWVIDRCLEGHGRGLIHTIGRTRPEPLNGWIERRIFPGAEPPSLGEMMEILEPPGFAVQDVENLRLHYARTLDHWLARYEAVSDEIRRMYDEDFVRAWRLYLAGSTAAFRTSTLQLYQVLFSRAGVNDVPLTRKHLYT